MASQGSFTSTDRSVSGRMARWVRIYRAPLVMSALFVAVLLALVVTSDPNRDARRPAGATDVADLVEAPARSPCPACGIGQRCDEATGQCIVVERTPLPCEEDTHYDEEQQYCVPDNTPPPVREPRVTREPAVTEEPPPTFDPNEPPQDPLMTPRPPSSPEPPVTPDAGGQQG
jgi:type VI secretion system secreted protein VgrG